MNERMHGYKCNFMSCPYYVVHTMAAALIYARSGSICNLTDLRAVSSCPSQRCPNGTELAAL